MKIHRMNGSIVVPLFFAAAVSVIAPQQVGVAVYKLSLVAMALWSGYWADRLVFPYSRPDKCDHQNMAELRRAVIIGCTVLAVSIGL